MQSIQDTASAIMALINSKPTSPTQAEIEAILLEGLNEGSGADDPLAQEWERAVAAHRVACADSARDNELDALQYAVAEATFAIWKRGARSVADLTLFARVARHWQWDDEDADFKRNLIPAMTGLDDQSVAQLVNAALKFPEQGTAVPAMSPEMAALATEWHGPAAVAARTISFGRGRRANESTEAFEDRQEAASEASDDLAERIMATPARTWDDVMLLAEIAWWAHWCGVDPRDPDGRAMMREYEIGYGGNADESLIALLKAIFFVAGIWPEPRQPEGEAPACQPG